MAGLLLFLGTFKGAGKNLHFAYLAAPPQRRLLVGLKSADEPPRSGTQCSSSDEERSNWIEDTWHGINAPPVLRAATDGFYIRRRTEGGVWERANSDVHLASKPRSLVAHAPFAHNPRPGPCPQPLHLRQPNPPLNVCIRDRESWYQRTAEPQRAPCVQRGQSSTFRAQQCRCTSRAMSRTPFA